MEDHSESGHVSFPIIFLLDAVLGMHALDSCFRGLLELFDHNACPADLTLPHDKFDSALFFEHLG